LFSRTWKPGPRPSGMLMIVEIAFQQRPDLYSHTQNSYANAS